MEENGKQAAPELRLDEADRLAVENIFLKLQNLNLQVEKMDRIVAEAQSQKANMVAQMKQLQDDIKKKRDELSAKYGTPIEASTVTADGFIKPKPVAVAPANSQFPS